MASRGEVDGPRVAEAKAALSWWRARGLLVDDLSVDPVRAESLLALIFPEIGTDAEAAEAAEAVAR